MMEKCCTTPTVSASSVCPYCKAGSFGDGPVSAKFMTAFMTALSTRILGIVKYIIGVHIPCLLAT